MTPQELRSIRERLGLTQRDLAEAIGVTATSVYRMETGRQRITDRTERQVRTLERLIAGRGAG